MKIFSKNCDFIAACHQPTSIIDSEFPEFAFIGRSNVGKSSLINAILSRKIARTSQTPGRTKQIIFFLLAEQLMLVDMPGYGYAKTSKKETRHLSNLIQHYLHQRHQLRRIFILIDSRRGMKNLDIAMLEFLMGYPIGIQIVLTKIDKINKTEQETLITQTNQIISQYPICFPEAIATSSNKKIGIENLQHNILEAINFKM